VGRKTLTQSIINGAALLVHKQVSVMSMNDQSIVCHGGSRGYSYVKHIVRAWKFEDLV